MNKLDAILDKFKNKIEIVVGFPKGKQVTYPPDDRKGHHNKGGQTVAQVAAWNEDGTVSKKTGKQISPARPFLKFAVKKNKEEISKMIKNAFLSKNLSDETYFDKIGIRMTQMVQDSIRNGPWIPNAQVTQFQKLTLREKKVFHSLDKKIQELILKKTRPLIDRGIMIKSVNYEVRRS